MFSRRRGTSRGARVYAKLQRYAERYRSAPGVRLACRISRTLESAGRTDEAFRWAKHARARYPTSRRARSLYLRLKKARTRAALREAKERARASRSAETLARLSELLRIAGRWKKARRIAMAADREFPESWEIQLSLGKLHFDSYSRTRSEDDGWAAVECLDRARCLNPRSYSTLILLAIALTRLHSYEDALLIIDETLELVPSDRRAQSLRAHVRKASAAAEAAPRRERAARPQLPAATAEDKEILERVMEIDGAVGAFRISAEGRVRGTLMGDGASFDLSVPAEVFESMAAACRLDTQRIGLGDFRSCSVSGSGWSADYHDCADGGVLAFFEGELTGEQIDDRVSAALERELESATKVGELAATD